MGPDASSEFKSHFDLVLYGYRGLEPLTFLCKGEQLNGYSLVNKMIVKAGDVGCINGSVELFTRKRPPKNL
jgi:hypothetical protein